MDVELKQLKEPHAYAAPSPQEANAATNLAGFAVLAAQITGLLFVFYYYHLETRDFLVMTSMVFGAFAIHYWLPFRFKELFWIGTSIAGSFVLLSSAVAGLLIAAGLTMFVILRSPVAFRWRVSLLSAFFAVLLYGSASHGFCIPRAFYAVFGGIFMFRMIIYVYDQAHAKQPASLRTYLSYFFILPNYYFALFPVVDFQTMRATYYRRNGHAIAQQGIHWMLRGGVQLMLYRVVLYFSDPYLPDRITSFPKLIIAMVLTFMLYLNVSGTFHIVVGMLHLFGYDLPETNRRYFLANSFLDFWRRINIYWKDFMVKVVYFPVYFKYRKGNELRAQILGTAAVFTISWIAHSYQSIWIEGKPSFSWPDTIFWGVLGMLVMINVVYDSRHKARKVAVQWQYRCLLAVRTLTTFAVITLLWSLWSSPSVTAWMGMMTRWTREASQ